MKEGGQNWEIKQENLEDKVAKSEKAVKFYLECVGVQFLPQVLGHCQQ